jgi:hypothetical protein
MAVSVSGSWIPMVSGVLARSGQPAPTEPPLGRRGHPTNSRQRLSPESLAGVSGHDGGRAPRAAPDPGISTATRIPCSGSSRALPRTQRTAHLRCGGGSGSQPFPSVADVGYVGWALPASVGLVQLARGTPRRLPGLRVNLDAVVIAGSLLFASWTLVLQSALSRSHESPWAKAVAVMYPLSDAVIAAMVLAVGSRSVVSRRWPWVRLSG